MRQVLLVLCGAVLLTGCNRSIASTPPSSPSNRPSPPRAATKPCLPTPQARQADGSATASDEDTTIRQGRLDLRDCDEKRRLLLDAWPR